MLFLTFFQLSCQIPSVNKHSLHLYPPSFHWKKFPYFFFSLMQCSRRKCIYKAVQNTVEILSLLIVSIYSLQERDNSGLNQFWKCNYALKTSKCPVKISVKILINFNWHWIRLKYRPGSQSAVCACTCKKIFSFLLSIQKLTFPGDFLHNWLILIRSYAHSVRAIIYFCLNMLL